MRFKHFISALLCAFLLVSLQTVDIHAETATISVPVYHAHTGSSGSGGGCYGGSRQRTETIEIPCNGTLIYFPDYDSSQCSGCGAGYSGDQSGRKCYHSTTSTRTYTEHYLTCGKGGVQVGTIYLEKSPTGWTTEVILTGSYETDGMAVSDTPFRWNGGSPVAEREYLVTENGTVSLQLVADANTDTGSAIATMDIRNIDHTMPQIDGFSQSTTEWTKEDITLTILNPRDLQPDGTEGCGLADAPFSFDGGETFQAEPEAVITDSGNIHIQIKDALGNLFQIEKQVNNIDKSGPTFTNIQYSEEENVRENTIYFEARDLQPDGSDGCGMDPLPYSTDGGLTWSATAFLTVTKNGTYEIWARDILGNIEKTQVVISNIDTIGPKVTHVVEPAGWTRGPVKIKFIVEDLQENGRPGVGLPGAFISYDAGKTWVDRTEEWHAENQVIRVWCRDLYDNITIYDGEIRYIDDITPWMEVIVEKDQLAVGETTYLQVNAIDYESGLPETPYSFDGGKTWVSSNRWQIDGPGTYLVMVRDNVDLVEYRYVTILPLTKVSTVPKTKKMPKTEPVEKAFANISLRQPKVETPKVELPVLEKKTQQNIRGTKPTEEVKRVWNWRLLGLLLLCLCLLLLGILFFLWIFFYKTIRVYGYQGEEKYRYLGRRWIGKKEALYLVNISKSMVEKTDTTRFKLIPSKAFVKRHGENQLETRFAKEQAVTVQIEEEMIVENYIAT